MADKDAYKNSNVQKGNFPNEKTLTVDIIPTKIVLIEEIINQNTSDCLIDGRNSQRLNVSCNKKDDVKHYPDTLKYGC